MDQTAAINPGPVPSPVPNIAPRTLPPSSGKRKLVIYALLIVLAVGLLVGGYFLGAYLQSKKVPVSTTAQEAGIIPAGYIKAQELIDAGGNLVSNSAIQVPYNGVLTVVDPGKSWTLRKGAKTVTIRQEGNVQVKYSRIAALNTPAQSITASDLKIGDSIALIALVNTKTGVVTVANITITPGAAQASPSASPAAQKP